MLLRRDEGQIATLTLNRPRQLNALSEALIDALATEIDRLAREPAVRVVVLAGAGPAFSAGHDLKEMRGRPDLDYYRALFAKCAQMMARLGRLPQPVIARVHGPAAAAGCQLVASADLAVATTDARFATSGINVGLFCATPAVPLTRVVPAKAAFEMLVTGDFIDAEEAHRLGLVNQVVPPGELDRAVTAMAGRILAKPAAAIAAGKRLVHAQRDKSQSEAYGLAVEAMACGMMAEDAVEGIDAFLAKRPPRWPRT
jgi:enoyl-CoA hydratase/carnithine racemase